MRQVHFMKMETEAQQGEVTDWKPCLAKSTACALNSYTELIYWLVDKQVKSRFWYLKNTVLLPVKRSQTSDNSFSFQLFLSSSLHLRGPLKQMRSGNMEWELQEFKPFIMHFSLGKYIPKKGSQQGESNLLKDVCRRIIYASLKLERVQMP